MKLFFVDDQINEIYYKIVKHFFRRDDYLRRLTMEKRVIGAMEKKYHIYLIDAFKGISWCMKEFDRIADIYEGDEDNEAVIITNSTDLLNLVSFDSIFLFDFKCEDFHNDFIALNNSAKSKYKSLDELYLAYANCKRIKSLDELCDRELRPAHNIRKLYLAGEFSEVYTSKRKNVK